MTQSDTERDIDTHDPTYCEECANTGYVTQYIDGGRLIAQIPCGCPQTEDEENDDHDDLPKPSDWWVAKKSWDKNMTITYSSTVACDIGVALLDAIQKWFKLRNKCATSFMQTYCRQRCREYILAYRQHHRLDRREYL
jgi:hypothetical protein